MLDRKGATWLARLRRTDAAVAALLFIFLLMACALTASASMNTVDFQLNFEQTQALVDRHSIYLAPGSQLGQDGANGQKVSKYGLGLPIVSAPLYAAGELVSGLTSRGAQPRDLSRPSVMLTNDFVTAITGALLFLLCRRLGAGKGVSAAVAVGWAVTTPAWVYADTFFGEPLVSLCLVLATLMLVEYGIRKDGSRFWALAVGSLSLGYALVTRVSNAILVPMFLLFALYLALDHPEGALLRRLLARARLRAAGSPRAATNADSRAVALALVALVVPLGLAVASVLWFNQARFGNLFDFGYEGETFSSSLLGGVYGLVASPGKGVVEYAPLVVLGAVSWPAFYRKRPALALLSLGVFAAALVQGALWWAWWAGWCWGPRFLVPVLPFMLLPLAATLEGSVSARRAAWALGGLGLAVNLCGALIDVNAYLSALDAVGIKEPVAYLRPDLSPILGHARYVLAWQHVDSQSARLAASASVLRRLIPIALAAGLAASGGLLFGPRGLARGDALTAEIGSPDSRGKVAT